MRRSPRCGRYAKTRNSWWLVTELYRSRHDPEATIGELARDAAGTTKISSVRQAAGMLDVAHISSGPC
jgi:hypothetical protein